MCRGVNLGTCCAQGCDDPITCQDTGGYCNAHDPFSWREDDDDDTEPTPVVVDDPEKRRAYTLNRLERAIPRLEASLSADHKRLDQMRAEMRALRALTTEVHIGRAT